jgi:PBSX family phage terminase large subunit
MFSKKQSEFLQNALKDINILSGVTGSGKSFIANLKFYQIICSTKNQSCLLTGNTSESLYKNVIKELLLIDKGINWIEYIQNPSRIKTITGNEIYCIGINNEGSDKRIKGGSVNLWYGDEVTTYPESSFDMCLTRLRGLENNKLVIKPAMFTCNPDNYLHYIKTRFIDGKDENVNYYKFEFEDNPSITQGFIDKLRKNYTGVFAQRMIEGNWVGNIDFLVIPEFTEAKEKILVKEKERPKYYDLYGALDPAFNDFTAYLLGYYDFINGNYYIEGECLFNKSSTPEIAENIANLEKELFGTKKIYCRVSDTSMQVIYDLVKLHGLQITPTRKDDKEAAINNVRVLISQDKLFIHPRCFNLIRQLKVATWNKNRIAFERTEKEGHYDLIDALIYLIRNIDKSKNPYPAYDGLSYSDYHIPEIKNNSKSELSKILVNCEE